MKLIAFLMMLFAMLTACHAQTAMHEATSDSQTAEQQNLIIYYDSQVGVQPLLNAVKAQGATLLYQYRIIHAIAISLNAEQNIEHAIAHFAQIDGVIAVNRDQVQQLH